MMYRILLLLTLSIGPVVIAQDYFAIVVQNESTTYHYPSDVSFTLLNEFGEQVEIVRDDSTLVMGDYTLKIEVPWKEEPEIIESDGGSLEIFILPADIREQNKVDHTTWQTVNYERLTSDDKKPYLEKESFSENESGEKDAYFIFSNGMTVSFRGKRIWAYQDGERLDVDGKYLVKGNEYLLKISYNTSSGKMWYVFESLTK